ncbi:MAG: hypothetical protein PF689_07880 [Deltaproteobacteria bacterium]|jgi:hypothetical protein|nr:hypothetical protein [Deltaproteobacteria bacterium]
MLYLLIFHFILFNSGTASGIPSIWLKVDKIPTLTKAKQLASHFQKDPAKGNSITQALILKPEIGSNSNYKVFIGPYSSKFKAMQNGLTLLLKPESKLEFFYLVSIEGTPLSLKLSVKKRKKLINSNLDPPYPRLGISLSIKTKCYKTPFAGLPVVQAAVHELSFRDEIFLIGEKLLCHQGNCRRWFLGITPSPYRKVWVPAGHVLPLQSVNSIKDPQGKLIKYTAADWYGKTASNYLYYGIIFLGKSTPFKKTFKLTRLFDLKVLLRNNKWAVFDQRGQKHLEFNRIPQWRPVSSLFQKLRERVQFFK